jgi:hypothetical protein
LTRLSVAESRVLFAGAALALAILAVGPASHEVVRHLIQAAPLMLACLIGARRPEVLRWMLAPFFLFWLLIAVLIWLFLLHVARILTGTFSPPEIALTVVMAVSAASGLAMFLNVRRRLPVVVGLGVFALALAAQFGAFALSIQPWVAHADGHAVSDAGPRGGPAVG